MGKSIRLSNGRRLVDDVIRVAQQTPLASYVREMDLSELVKLRNQYRPRISWNVLFMKAYALVSVENPLLRTAYVSFPWPYLYEHDETVCILTVAKEYKNENRLMFARVTRPEIFTLLELQEKFDYFRRCELDEIRQFRHQVLFAKFPSWIRRMIWAMIFKAFPRRRLKNMGTFGMTLSGYGETKGTGNVLGPATSSLAIDLLPKKGISYFGYTFDHRVLDGKPAMDMIEELRKALLGPIAEELRAMIAQRQAENERHAA